MDRVIKNPFARMQKVAVETLRSLCNFSFVKLIGNNLMIPICVSLFCLSCSNKNEADMNNQSLEGTKWKLEGIWYEESQIFRVLEPLDCNDCYTLTFDTETTAHGFVINTPVGLVISGKDAIAISPNTGGESVRDAKYYMDAFFALTNNPYSISETEMKLYFSGPIGITDWEGLGIEVPVFSLNNYLLFKKVKE